MLLDPYIRQDPLVAASADRPDLQPLIQVEIYFPTDLADFDSVDSVPFDGSADNYRTSPLIL